MPAGAFLIWSFHFHCLFRIIFFSLLFSLHCYFLPNFGISHFLNFFYFSFPFLSLSLSIHFFFLCTFISIHTLFVFFSSSFRFTLIFFSLSFLFTPIFFALSFPVFFFSFPFHSLFQALNIFSLGRFKELVSCWWLNLHIGTSAEQTSSNFCSSWATLFSACVFQPDHVNSWTSSIEILPQVLCKCADTVQWHVYFKPIVQCSSILLKHSRVKKTNKSM